MKLKNVINKVCSPELQGEQCQLGCNEKAYKELIMKSGESLFVCADCYVKILAIEMMLNSTRFED